MENGKILVIHDNLFITIRTSKMKMYIPGESIHDLFSPQNAGGHEKPFPKSHLINHPKKVTRVNHLVHGLYLY